MFGNPGMPAPEGMFVKSSDIVSIQISKACQTNPIDDSDLLEYKTAYEELSEVHRELIEKYEVAKQKFTMLKDKYLETNELIDDLRANKNNELKIRIRSLEKKLEEQIKRADEYKLEYEEMRQENAKERGIMYAEIRNLKAIQERMKDAFHRLFQ